MIQKVSTFKDITLDNQINEIVRGQFLKIKEVSVTFSTSGITEKADVGFYANRYIPTSKNASIDFWYINSDERYMYFIANGAGTVTMKVWKEG